MEQIMEIPLTEIHIDEEFNSRDQIHFTQVIDLAKSIEKDGLIQPILVMPFTGIEGKKFQVVAGHRRYKAHMILSNGNPKFSVIKAVVRTDLTEKQARILNLNENLARKDLNIVEESMALIPLLKLGMSEEEMVKELPTASRGWVQVRLMLLKLPKEIRDEAALGFLTQNQIRDLYSLKLNNTTDDVLFAKVREAKDAKLKGEVYKIKRKEKDTPIKEPSKQQHARVRHEIFVMIDHMLAYKLQGIGTRALAWAAGEISDLDFFLDLREYAEQNGLDYEINRQGLDYGKAV